MTRDKIIKAALNNMTEGLYVTEAIPSNKRNNVINHYPVPGNETILILYDNTVFGSAKCGFVITDQNIYVKKDWTESNEMFLVSLETLENVQLELKENVIYFDSQYYFSPVQGNVNSLFNMFRELQSDPSNLLEDILKNSTISFEKPEWMKADSDDFSYNVVIAGKTGVGKSSFINYLFGDAIRPTGAGKPVTKRGFFPQDYTLNGMKMTLYDSWGLEIGKEEEWRADLDRELDKRSSDAAIKDWFHTVFYCISAGGTKVEDFEIDILRDFVGDNYTVNVILTKADQASEDEIQVIRNEIELALGENCNLIEVCSEEKEMYGGNISKPFGKEEAEKAIVDGMWESIPKRLPDACVEELLMINEEWFEELKLYISDAINNGSAKDVMNFVNEKISAYADVLNNKLISQVVFEKLSEASSVLNHISKNLNFDNSNLKFNELDLMLKELDSINNETDINAIWANVSQFAGGAAIGFIASLVFTLPIAIPVILAGTFFLGKGIDSLFSGNKEKQIEKINQEIEKIKKKIDETLLELKPELKKKFSDLKDRFILAKPNENLKRVSKVSKTKNKKMNHFVYGLVLYELGFYEEAKRTFKQHLLKEPDEVNARYNLGLCLTQLQSYDEAIVDFKKVLKKEPNYEDAYLRLGEIYRGQNLYSKAIKYYREALKVNNQNQEAQENLMNVYLESGKFNELCVYCRALIQTDPNNVGSYYYLSKSYLASNDFQEACDVCSEYLERDSGNLYILFQRGVVLKAAGNYTEALEDLTRALNLAFSYENFDLACLILYHLAETCFYLQEPQKALRLLNYALENFYDLSQFELFTYCYLTLNRIEEYDKVSKALKEYDRETYLEINKIAQKEFGVYS